MGKNDLRIVRSAVDAENSHWSLNTSSEPLYVRGTDLHMSPADKLDEKLKQFNLENLTKTEQFKLRRQRKTFANWRFRKLYSILTERCPNESIYQELPEYWERQI